MTTATENPYRTFVEKTARLYRAGTEPLVHYLVAIAGGATREEAHSIGSATYAGHVAGIVNGGLFTEAELSRLCPTFDPLRSTGGILVVVSDAKVDEAASAIAREPGATRQ